MKRYLIVFLCCLSTFAGDLSVGTRFTIGQCHEANTCVSFYAHEAVLSWPSVEAVEKEVSAEFHGWMAKNFKHWQFVDMSVGDANIQAMLEASVEDEIKGSGKTVLVVRLSAGFLQDPVEIGREVIYDEHYFKATVLDSAEAETDVLKQKLGAILNTTRRQQVEDQLKTILPVALFPKVDEEGTNFVIPLSKKKYGHLSNATFSMLSTELQVLIGKSRGESDSYIRGNYQLDDALVLIPQSFGEQLFQELPEETRQNLQFQPVVFLKEYSQFNFNAFASLEP